MIPAIPPNHPVQPFFDPRYDVLWATCAELDLPVHQHQGSGSPEIGRELAVGQAVFFAELELWTRRTLLHLIMGGVFERHPRLRVVWTEMWGIRWALEELARIDKRLLQPPVELRRRPARSSTTAPRSDRRSSTTCRSRRASTSPATATSARACCRVTRCATGTRSASTALMWGDDFPHPEGATGLTPEALRATMFDVPIAECRQMLAGVAAGVYGFDLGALTPIAARHRAEGERGAHPADRAARVTRRAVPRRVDPRGTGPQFAVNRTGSVSGPRSTDPTKRVGASSTSSRSPRRSRNTSSAVASSARGRGARRRRSASRSRT